MPAAPSVRPVVSSADLKSFIRLPIRLFSKQENWTPLLMADIKKRLDRKRNPFFRHSEAQEFLAERDGRVVGRISAILNRRHLEIHQDGAGFFGWFDCEDDPEAARALLDAARGWVQSRGCRVLRGPASFSLNDECGLLIQGHDTPAAVLTNWNPPYYADLVERAGFTKSKDLLSFVISPQVFKAERMARIVEKVKQRENLTLRHFDMKRFSTEVDAFKAIYNDAWTDNWGFVPLTEDEISDMAKDMKPVIEPRLLSFVEVEGRPVGFSMVLPDLNAVMRRIRGRLFPFGFLQLIRGRKRLGRLRLLAMGMVRDMQRRGLDSVLYYSAFSEARDLGNTWTELGWVLEDNTVMINAIEHMGGVHYKTHRLYDAAVTPSPTGSRPGPALP